MSTEFKQHYGTGTDPFDLFKTMPISEQDTGLTVFLREDIIKRMFRITSKDEILDDIKKCRDELDRLELELLPAPGQQNVKVETLIARDKDEMKKIMKDRNHYGY